MPYALAGRLLAAAAPVGRDEARDAARRELSREIYHRDDPSLFSRLTGALAREVERLFAGAADRAPGGSVGLLALVLVVVVLVVAIRLKVGPLARSTDALDGGGGWRSMTAIDHRREADRLAAAGAWAGAVRERLRAVVRELEGRGVLESRPGRTATEVAAEAGSVVPAIAADLRAAARAFDEIWYGGRPATVADDALLRGVDERVRLARLAAPAAPPPDHLAGASA